MASEATLLPLWRADGSASYSCNEYSVLAAVNGPVEIQKRDELSEEAAVDVVVRPLAGVGGVRERHLESIIHRTLRHVIVVSAHPRKLIQVTLQITGIPDNDSMSAKPPQASSNLSVLPVLLQASILALLSAAIPLAMMFTSTIIAVDSGGNFSQDPSPKEIATAESLHVLAFSSLGQILVAESEGSFGMELWEDVVEQASKKCRGLPATRDKGDAMEVDSDNNNVVLESIVRKVVRSKVIASQRWKGDLR